MWPANDPPVGEWGKLSSDFHNTVRASGVWPQSSVRETSWGWLETRPPPPSETFSQVSVRRPCVQLCGLTNPTRGIPEVPGSKAQLCARARCHRMPAKEEELINELLFWSFCKTLVKQTNRNNMETKNAAVAAFVEPQLSWLNGARLSIQCSVSRES